MRFPIKKLRNEWEELTGEGAGTGVMGRAPISLHFIFIANNYCQGVGSTILYVHGALNLDPADARPFYKAW